MPRFPFGLWRVWLVAAIVFSGLAAAGAEPAKRLGVLTDNYPYSFRETDGQMTGFAYELAIELERLMGLSFTRIAGTTDEINTAFAAGQIDVVQSYAEFPERRAHADFSVPYLTMSGAIVVRRGTTGIHALADLRGRKVLVHRGSFGEKLLREAGLGDSVVYAESVEQSLARVDRGEGDATLVTRLSGLSAAHRLGLKNLQALDVRIPGYEVRYCLAVKPGDRETLAQINEGLATLVRTGRFDRLYAKWFGYIDPPGYTFEQIMLAVAIGLMLALVVTIWALMRQRALRRRISLQAEALRIGEERYRGIFEGVRDGLLVVHKDGSDWQVEQINPPAEKMLGVQRAAAVGLSLTKILPEEASLVEQVRRSVGLERASEFEHARGEKGAWRLVVHPMGARMLVSIVDISEQVAARERLRLQEDQLRQKQKLEAIGTLAGGVAHDFNNLLTGIMGNTELALMTLPSDSQESVCLQQALQASRRARDLVRQILTFARRSEPRREVLKLEPLIHETIDLLRTLGKGMVQFEVQVAPNLPPVLADPAQVHQVLMNIGTNAVQAMRGGTGQLVFQAEAITADAGFCEQHRELRPGCFVRVGIRDTGPGMSPEVQRRVFEPFFTTKAPNEGTGLGLSVVHGIMQQHAGAITLYSQLGRGTIFHLYFPATESKELPEKTDGTEIVEQVASGVRVLLVDDDPGVIETAQKMLGRLGCTSTSHLRAEPAWSEWSSAPERFALVISDLTMPGMSGLQLLAQMRGRRAEQRFLLMSGFFSEAELAEAKARQVSGVLYKPLSYTALSHALAAIMGAASRG